MLASPGLLSHGHGHPSMVPVSAISVAAMVNDTEISSHNMGDILTQLEQDVLENSRAINEIPLQINAAHGLESISYQDQADLMSELGEFGKKKARSKKRKRALDKDGKEPQLNTCLAVGCERQIRQRRLCPMHQKQKERNNGKIEIKENVKFNKGRTPTPFSKHANKYAKLKIFDRKINEWAGGKEEGSMMLEHYLESSYYQGRFPKQEDYKIYEQIGKNMIEFMRYLPEKSPLRRPLIKAISENVPLSKLREVLPVSKQTVLNSKKLPDQENLLLTIRYKLNVARKRKGNSMDMDGMDDLHDELQMHGGQTGPQLEPPQVDSSSHDIIQTGDLHNLPLSYAAVSHLANHL